MSERTSTQNPTRSLYVPSANDILRYTFPPGTGVTPWAVRPRRDWSCEICGEMMIRQDIGVADVSRHPWGATIQCTPAHWRHFVSVGIPGNGDISRAESVMREVLHGHVRVARWHAEHQRIQRIRHQIDVT